MAYMYGRLPCMTRSITAPRGASDSGAGLSDAAGGLAVAKTASTRIRGQASPVTSQANINAFVGRQTRHDPYRFRG